jgi:glycine hydroxymethyltransferase
LADSLLKKGMTLVCGGTECHLLVIDLRPLSLSGNVVAEALEKAGIVANRNAVPNDNMPPFYPSGVRLGTPGLTTRGMKEKEMKIIADYICQIINYVKNEKLPAEKEKRSEFIKAYRNRIKNDKFLKEINKKIKILCQKFPIP